MKTTEKLPGCVMSTTRSKSNDPSNQLYSNKSEDSIQEGFWVMMQRCFGILFGIYAPPFAAQYNACIDDTDFVSIYTQEPANLSS